MDYEILFPGRFVKSVDLKGKEVTLTIASIKAEEIDEKQKAIISFESTKKSMVLNRTNAEALKLMFGRDTDGWLGKRVTIYPAVMKDPFGDGDITALRVRGSPDIAQAMNATIQRGRKTIKVSVVPTGDAKAAAKPKPKAAAPAAPSNGVPPPISDEEAASILAAEADQASGL